MKSSHLRVGDRISITGVPGIGIPNYFLPPATARVFKKLRFFRDVARKKWPLTGQL